MSACLRTARTHAPVDIAWPCRGSVACRRSHGSGHRAAGGRGVGGSSDPSFRGNPDHLNPAQLLLAAASSCQLLSFRELAARAGVDEVHYEDHAEAALPATRDRMRITTITLRPRM